mmetsp:Transcript_19101/g.54835  ORF Transcript_19101/g.54835 Transcript_19101/m.54835 type:complete len:244 (+) Transcript_19101:1663-2394(+)
MARTSFGLLLSPAVAWAATSSGSILTRSWNLSTNCKVFLSHGSCLTQVAATRVRKAFTHSSVSLKFGSNLSSRMRCGNSTLSTLWRSWKEATPRSKADTIALLNSSSFVESSKCKGISGGGLSSAALSFLSSLPFFLSLLSGGGAAAAMAALITAMSTSRNSARKSVCLNNGSRTRSPPSAFGSAMTFLIDLRPDCPSPSSRRSGTRASTACTNCAKLSSPRRRKAFDIMRRTQTNNGRSLLA